MFLNGSKSINTNALLDTDSDLMFVILNIPDELKLPRKTQHISFPDALLKKILTSELVDLAVSSMSDSDSINVKKAGIVDSISYLPTCKRRPAKKLLQPLCKY